MLGLSRLSPWIEVGELMISPLISLHIAGSNFVCKGEAVRL